MAKLMLHKNVLKNFSKLPVKVQKEVSELIGDFHDNPKRHVHGLKETMADPKVRGANLKDGYRAIIIAPEKGDTHLLMYIDKHDEAYNWAKNKHFEVHESTGVFQVFDVQKVVAVAEKPRAEKKPRSDYPLNQLSDSELFQAGVPKALIPAVRAIDSDTTFEALEDYLPQDCKEVLFGIASGMSLDESLELTLGKVSEEAETITPSGPGDFTQIEDAPNFDLVLVEGEEQLRDVLSKSLEEWRVFLHPSQYKIVYWETKGPMNINGAAGTGKTVALLHRAVFLANKLTARNARILLTTFTTNLSITLKNQMQQLDPKAAEHVEVTNLHALARTICQRSGWSGRVAQDKDTPDIWDEVFSDKSLGEAPFTKEELKDEYKLIIDPNGIEDEDAYLTTVRSGRRRIGRKQRKQAWPFFRAFQRGLKKRNFLTFEGAIHQARLAVEQGNFPRYAHVLVDEVQDFSLEALRLIRALSPSEEGALNPLCTAGDGHQRIYHVKIPMSRAGINIRGRSRRLKINYRTSEQIRQWAQGILEGVEIDDLDGGLASIVGDRSVFKGPTPQIEKCEDEKKEAEAIVTWVKHLLADKDKGFGTHEICITPYKKTIRSALESADISTFELKPREDDPGNAIPGIRMGTMHRIKGLEFRAVAMACAKASDPINNIKDADVRKRCLRYVAATRAREALLITMASEEEEKEQQ